MVPLTVACIRDLRLCLPASQMVPLTVTCIRTDLRLGLPFFMGGSACPRWSLANTEVSPCLLARDPGDRSFVPTHFARIGGHLTTLKTRNTTRVTWCCGSWRWCLCWCRASLPISCLVRALHMLLMLRPLLLRLSFGMFCTPLLGRYTPHVSVHLPRR